jgi:hypothetical protein
MKPLKRNTKFERSGRGLRKPRPRLSRPEDPVFFPLLTLVLSTTLGAAVLGFSSSAQAQDDSGQFVNGNAGAPPNTDSENVPGAVMQTPSYAGTGCPQGSASATLSPDGKTLSVLFDSYVAEAGGGAPMARDSKGCQINIPFIVPPGFAVQVVKMDYRGFTSLPAGSRSTFGAGFRFLEVNERLTNAPRVVRASVMQGPKTENFVLTSVIQGRPFSPCGQNFILAAESTLNVQSNRAGEQTISTVDSVDAVQTPVVYSLRWKRCGGQGEGRPDSPPGRPPGVGGGPPPGGPGRPFPPPGRPFPPPPGPGRR